MTLSCPTDQSYAAIAKQLHQTALEAEQRIFGLDQLLRSAGNRPTMVQVSASAVTGIPASTEWNIGSIGGANYSTLFNNTAAEFIDDTNIFTILGEGIYEVGMFAHMRASGVVNDNSQRYFSVFHHRPDQATAGTLQRVTEATQHLFEPNAGIGVDCCVVNTFRAQREDRVSFSVFHTNTSSTISVFSGSIVYLTKLSDTTVVTVT